MKKIVVPWPPLRPSRNRREWVRDIVLWQSRLAPRFPEIDWHDMGLILHTLLRPRSVPMVMFIRSIYGDWRVP